jgi:hypothetical protein
MTHMLHGAEIFSSMYPNNGPNVGKYSMEHMGLIIEYGNLLSEPNLPGNPPGIHHIIISYFIWLFLEMGDPQSAPWV